jgi:NADH kinase
VIDYIFTFGGDGAIIYAMKDFKYRIPPVITFRGGTLGWMCRFSQSKVAEVAQKIVAYHGGQIKFPFEISREMRMMVTKRSKVDFKTSRACLNQVFIQRKDYTNRMTLSIFINNKFLTRTTVAGLLIATPTGSTLHSLYSGGPAIQNGVEAIMITPIIPNSLAFRPLLLPATSEIKIKVSIC